MGELTNPYDCSRPGTLFMGYEQTRRRMVRGLKNGKSYAVLGGRRCGKTSFLLEIEKDISKEASETHKLLPRLLDMQAILPKSPEEFFGAIYGVTVQDCGAPTVDIHNYQSFLSEIDKALPMLELRYGVNWIVTLLIDELEAAVERMKDLGGCLENLRNLLMVSRHWRQFRAVVGGGSRLRR